MAFESSPEMSDARGIRVPRPMPGTWARPTPERLKTA